MLRNIRLRIYKLIFKSMTKFGGMYPYQVVNNRDRIQRAMFGMILHDQPYNSYVEIPCNSELPDPSSKIIKVWVEIPGWN